MTDHKPLDLAPIEERLRGATGGMLVAVKHPNSFGSIEEYITLLPEKRFPLCYGDWVGKYTGPNCQRDAEFGAHAFTDLLFCVTEIKRLRATVTKLRGALASVCVGHDTGVQRETCSSLLYPDQRCNCGATEHNAAIEQVLKETEGAL